MESNLKIVEWNIDKLISAEYNPRKLSEEQKQKIKDSISRFGLVDPVIVNTNKERFGIIIGGHQRTKVSREMGFKKMPCVELDLNLDQEKELNVRLNKNTGEFDKELLVEYFDQDDLIDWGFDNEYFEDVVTEIDAPEEDDFNGELPSEPQTVLGDLYELNGHRVHCASSTEIDAVEKLMDGKKADMVFTDPPYNIGFEGSMSNKMIDGKKAPASSANQKHNSIKNDKMSDKEFYQFMYDFLTELKNNCSGSYYVCFGSQTLNQLLTPLIDLGIEYKSIIIWMKNQAIFSGKDFKSRYEPIVYGRFNKSFFGERFNEEDIWEFARTQKNDLHPTMKPIPLIENAIKYSSEKYMLVLDFFLGSGSTLIACEQLDRKCYGQELDPKYCDVIVKRWVKYMTDNDRKFTVKRNGEDITKETWINE